MYILSISVELATVYIQSRYELEFCISKVLLLCFPKRFSFKYVHFNLDTYVPIH